MSTLIIGTPRKVSLTGPAGPCNNRNQGKLARVPKEIASLMAARASGTSSSIISLGFRGGGLGCGVMCVGFGGSAFQDVRVVWRGHKESCWARERESP